MNIQNLNNEIDNCKSKLSTLPEGKIYFCHQGNSCKWYYANKGKVAYLPKSERDLAKKLAEKKYLEAKIHDLEAERDAAQVYQSQLSAPKAAENLLADPACVHLLSENYQLTGSRLREWSTETYQQNPRHPEGLIHKSISGNVLRSKSEAMIDLLLFQNKIPYRYECELHLDSFSLYPDFTIMHPRSEQIIYWEHNGMMDDSKYNMSHLKKSELYFANGIIPGDNLIYTYETQEKPLSPAYVQMMIDHYLK